jgi:hypothetical protein
MGSDNKKYWFEKRPALFFTLVIVTGILLIDFISAGILIPEDYNSFRIHSPFYHHGLIPNRHASNIWGDRIFEIYTNSLGFKDKSCREITLVPDKKRVLFIGDSFTESMGMTWDESFPGILAHELPHLEILNAGVVSYSPKLYYLKVRYLLEQKKLRFDELYVFIDNSDPLNELTYRDFEIYSKKSLKDFRMNLNRYLFKHSYIYYSISNKLISSRRKSKVTENWNPVSGPAVLDEFSTNQEDFTAATVYWSYSQKTFEKWGKSGLELADLNMQNLTDLCRQYKIRLTVVIYPWTPMIINHDLYNIQVSHWEEFCRQNEIRFINLYSSFINNRAPDETIRKYFIPGDVHWNQEGNRFVAEQLKPYLSE